MLLGTRGFREQWQAFRQALKADEPLPFTWVAIGSRIINTGMWIREQYDYREGEICIPFLGLSGVVSYGGRRKRGFGIKRGYISEDTLRSLDDTRTLRAPTPKRKRAKGHRKIRATVDGRMVLLTHKGRKVLWRTCVTEQTAQLTADRLNGKFPE